MAAAQWVYRFGGGKAEGDASMRNLLGGKGANLAEMANLGLPVPPGFTITTEVCTDFYRPAQQLSGRARAPGRAPLVEGSARRSGRRFGDPERPLLVSVRSGARVSMPGMMDTVLNLGLNDADRRGAGARAQATAASPMTAIAASSRCIPMWCWASSTILRGHSRRVQGREGLVPRHRSHRRGLDRGHRPLQGPCRGGDRQALPAGCERAAVGRDSAPCSSRGMSARAVTYRRLHGIPEDWGTAVSVQAMVFGNMGDTSATGVAFTRNPSTGEHELYGEFLVNAQGEDVVAGIRTPQNITEAARIAAQLGCALARRADAGDFRASSTAIFDRLERHYRDMQDLEFTIENGRLWMLQTRSGKRTAQGGAQDRRRHGR